MELGNQYKLDNEFKAAARLHQSKYRAEILQVKYEDYGNRLNEHDAKALLNYYDKLNVRTALRDRFPIYSKKRDADMLRSEHIPFNLLAPLDTDRQTANKIICSAFGINCGSIQSIDFEYAPEPNSEYLHDGTAFDTYITILKPDGMRSGIGIEVKYTEQSYNIGVTEKINVDNKESLYWRTARSSDVFIDPDNDAFGTDELRQIWRNHLLGLSMITHGDIDEFYSITLFPDGNKHFHDELPRYRSFLKDTKKEFVLGCTYEQYISAIGGTPDFDEWQAWLLERYVVK